jgi:hypothetical protein
MLVATAPLPMDRCDIRCGCALLPPQVRVPPAMGSLKSLKELNLRSNNLDDRYKAKVEEGLSRWGAGQPLKLSRAQLCRRCPAPPVARLPLTCLHPSSAHRRLCCSHLASTPVRGAWPSCTSTQGGLALVHAETPASSSKHHHLLNGESAS